jgi:hypothetical protein
VTSSPALGSGSARRCQVSPLNGSRGANRETSLKRAEAIGRPSSVAVQRVRVSGPYRSLS